MAVAAFGVGTVMAPSGKSSAAISMLDQRRMTAKRIAPHDLTRDPWTSRLSR